MPFYKLWVEIEKSYTSGDGYLDKLCMELVGLDFQPLPAADPRRARAVPRALPAYDARDRRAGRAAGVRRGGVASVRPSDPLSEQDNVAVAVKNITQGAKLAVDGADARVRSIRSPSPTRSRFVRSSRTGGCSSTACRSAGQSRLIEAGRHVHVHNIRSDYVNNKVD